MLCRSPESPLLREAAMQCNVGKGDKVFRIIVGLAIIIAGWIYGSWWGAIGLIPLLTAIVGYCPAYSIFGTSTCKTEEPKIEAEVSLEQGPEETGRGDEEEGQ